MLLDLNLNQLYTFYVIAREKSMKKASHLLCISSPAVTIQIQKLEEYLGFKLFIRNRTTIELSEQGKMLYPKVKELFKNVENVHTFIEKVRHSEKKELLIGINKTPAEYFIPTILHLFKDKEQFIKFSIIDVPKEQELDILYERKVDLMLVANTLKAREDPHIKTKLFLKEKLAIAVDSKNPLAKEKSIDINILSQIPLIGQPKDTSIYPLVQSYFKKHKVKPTLAIENITLVVAKKIIRESNYASFFPTYLIKDEIDTKQIALLNMKEELPEIEVAFVYLEESQLIQDFFALF